MNNKTTELSEHLMFLLSGMCISILLISFIIYFIFLYSRKQRDHINEQKKLELKFKQELLESQIEIQKELLRQVSSEIHDNLGQLAALVKLNLLTFPSNLSPESLNKLEQTKELMKKLMSDLKSLSISLNSDYLEDEYLFRILEIECERLNRSGTIKTVFIVSGIEPILDDGKKVFIYRMVQELLNNILRHSEATVLTVQANGNETGLTIQVEDNGKGFDSDLFFEKESDKISTGLKSLNKRSKLIGANFTINSVIGLGTKALIKLPITNQ